MNKHQIFLIGAFGFILGIGIGDFNSFRPAIVLAGILLCLIFLLRPARGPVSTSFILFFLFVFFGLAYIGSYQKFWQPSNIPFGKEISISGVIVRQPERSTDGQKIVIRMNKFTKPTNILIKTKNPDDYRYGDRLKIVGKIEKPKKFADFDYAGFLEKDGIWAIVSQTREIVKVDENRGNLLISRLYRLRQKFEDSLDRSFPEPQAALTAGIILGSKRNIPDSLIENFNRTGTSHIIAVSGYNLTIIVTVLVSLGISQTIQRRFQILTGFIIFFVLLTGGSASIVRGGLVSWLSIWARANSRIAWPLPLLLTTMLAMIVHNPLILIHDVGFQLSTAAFAGLLFIAPTIHRNVGTNGRSPLRWIPKNITQPLIETFSASMPTIPLIALSFGRISTVFLIVNLLILWTIPLIMALGFLAGLGGMIHPTLGIVLAQPCIVLENYLLWIVEVFGSWPFASIEV